MRYCAAMRCVCQTLERKRFRTINVQWIGQSGLFSRVAVPGINNFRAVNVVISSTPAASTTTSFIFSCLHTNLIRTIAFCRGGFSAGLVSPSVPWNDNARGGSTYIPVRRHCCGISPSMTANEFLVAEGLGSLAPPRCRGFIGGSPVTVRSTSNALLWCPRDPASMPQLVLTDLFRISIVAMT